MYRGVIQRGYNAKDPLSTLELLSKPIPTAAPGYVVVHITIRPINPTDLISIRTGRVAKANQDPIIGSEGFGIVETIGDGVIRVKPGQRVVPILFQERESGNGSWQEYVTLKEDLVVPIPDSIADEVAAQFVINLWTVIGMLRDSAVPKGEYLIQTAAGSSLGRQVIKLAKHVGVKTINIVRRPDQKEELFALGADEVICSTTEDIVERVREITSGKLAHGALDCVGGNVTKAVAASVRNEGQVFVYGSLSSNDATVSIPNLRRGISLKSWTIAKVWDDREDVSKQTIQYLEDKTFELISGEKLDLADFKTSIEKSEQVGRGGKVLLTSAPK
ncbi:unnamed protein product [Calypogeia fissa]